MRESFHIHIADAGRDHTKTVPGRRVILERRRSDGADDAGPETRLGLDRRKQDARRPCSRTVYLTRSESMRC
jgi:hypothetical protein